MLETNFYSTDAIIGNYWVCVLNSFFIAWYQNNDDNGSNNKKNKLKFNQIKLKICIKKINWISENLKSCIYYSM